jgi:hypothetical protein
MDTIEVSLPVSRAAAEQLREPATRSRLGALVSLAMASDATAGELAEAVRLLAAPADERREVLRSAFTEMQQAAAEAGITSMEVEAELTARKRLRIAAARRGAAARRR